MMPAVVPVGRTRDSFALLPGRSPAFGPDPGVHVAADGVVTLPDGGLRAVLAVEPINFACRGPAEQEILSAQFAALVGSLAPGQTLQVLVESRPIDAATLLPRLFARLRPAGRAMTEFLADYRPWLAGQFARTHVPDLRFSLVVAPAPVQRELGETQRSPRAEAARARRALDQALDQCQRHLHGMQIDARPLRRGDVLRLLWGGLHPPADPCPPEERFPGLVEEDPAEERPARPRLGARLRELAGLVPGSALPAAVVEPFWLRRLLTSIGVEESLRALAVRPAGNGPAVYARSLFLLEPAEFTDPGWLDPLVGIGCPIRLALHVEGLDRKAERARLKRRRRSLNVLTLSATQAGGVGDIDVESAQAEARQQALETQDPARKILRWGLYVTVFAESPERLAVHTERVLTVLRTQMIAEVGRGIGHQLPLWQATLPLGLDPAGRRYRVRSETVGNCFPFLSHNPGMAGGMPIAFTATNHELVLLDPEDASLNNLLMNFVGKTGSGKTMAAQQMAWRVLQLGGRVMVVDKAGHYETLLAVVGGTAVRLGAAEQPAINLWDGPPIPSKITFVVNAHEVLLATNPGDRLDPLTRAALSEGVRAVYAAAAGRTPLERDLVAWLQAEGLRREGAERDRLRDLAIKLSTCVQEGEAAALLDRPTSVDLEDRLVVFDLEGLARELQPLAMFIIADCVRRRADRPRRPGDGIRELLIIDEGWYFIRYAAARSWLDELARKTRHWGLAVIFITQKLSDLVEDPAAKTLFDSASVQLLFRQRDAQAEGESPVTWLRNRLGLSAEEADRLYSLATVPGQYAEALLVRETKNSVQPRRGVVQLFCHPLEYWLFTTEALRDVPYRNAMVEALGGDVWSAVRACAAGMEVPDAPPLAAAGIPEQVVGEALG